MPLIRIAQPNDGSGCAAIYRPFVEESCVSFETIAPDAVEMRARIEKTLDTHPWLIADDGGAVVGYAYGSPHRERAAYRWSVDVTIYLAERARGKGLGSRMYRVLLNLLAKQGYRAAFAGIALPNEASIAAHESVGFTHLGTYVDVGYKLGDWRSVGWWGRELTVASGPPLEPVRYSVGEYESAIKRLAI